MSGENPHLNDSAELASQLRGLDDDVLLAALREILGQDHEAPSWFADVAKDSYGLRVTDSELAALTSDSADEVSLALRADSPPRLVSFEASQLSIEIEIQRGAHGYGSRLIGQLMPAGSARIHVRRAGEQDALIVVADERGRFTCEDLTDGPLSLIVERHGHAPTASAWIAVG